jgi:hypothetical protein
LGSINTAQAFAQLSTQNGDVTDTSGTFPIQVADSSGALLGQQSLAYIIEGNGAYAQNPVAVHDWLAGFTQYGAGNVTVTISASDIKFVPTIQSGTAIDGQLWQCQHPAGHRLSLRPAAYDVLVDSLSPPQG